MPKIEVDLHMLNSGSEFSVEEKGVVTLNIILLVVYMYFLATTTYAVFKQAMGTDNVEAPSMACVFAVYMELLHIATQCVHLYIYSKNGSGFLLLSLVSTILQMNSQIIIVGMLIMISYGWLITDVDLTQNTKLIVLGVIACLFQSLFTFLTAIDDGAHHKYHDYGGFQGFALISLRVILFFVFIFGVISHYSSVSKKAQSFLKAMAVAGTLYILAFPTLWILSHIAPAYLRNRLIVFGNLGVQLISIIILLNQLAKKGTKFYEASQSYREVLPKTK